MWKCSYYVATAGLAVLWVVAGCTPAQYAGQADRTAYATIASGQKASLGEKKTFDVTYRPFVPEDNAIEIAGRTIPIGGDKSETLTLDDCLEVAFRNSRSFQTRKESLYSTALALANSRRTWNFSFLTGDLTGEAEHSRISKDGETNSGSGEAGLSFTQRFLHGGVLTLGYALDIATDFVGWNSTTLGSLMEANFTQPLLQGAWRGLAYENQYRNERDFLFSVFNYERFTQTFAVDIVTRYYSVLQRRDRLENERTNIDRLKQTLALTRVMVEGGQVSRIQQDQAEQDMLNAQVRFETSRQSYRDALDGFKLTLGLPVVANLELDYPRALEELAKSGPKPIGLAESEAIVVALSSRPDVLTEAASLRDAERDVEIAADAFLPQLDLGFGISAPGSGTQKFYRTQFHRHTRFARVDFNYSLDQTDNRDAHRNALIALAKARRDYAEFLDTVRLEVRQSYRELMQSQRSYGLQVRNVEIAKRRRKLAALQQKEGQASARDVLEAEEALRSAQNGLTGSLVGYTTTRLNFLASLGMIWIDEKGKLHEREKPFQFDLIGRRHPYVVAR